MALSSFSGCSHYFYLFSEHLQTLVFTSHSPLFLPVSLTLCYTATLQSGLTPAWFLKRPPHMRARTHRVNDMNLMLVSLKSCPCILSGETPLTVFAAIDVIRAFPGVSKSAHRSCYYDPIRVSFPLSENKQESSWLLLFPSQWGLQTACAWQFGDGELEIHF